ncbi:MAG: hypothetical protein ACRD1K_01660 [Acidimicrobiales bacterium]
MSRRVDGAGWTFGVTVDPPSLGAGLQAVVVATGVPTDVKATDVAVNAQPPAALEAGLAFGGCLVAAAGAVSVIVVNNTAGTIDGAARVWQFTVLGNESPV